MVPTTTTTIVDRTKDADSPENHALQQEAELRLRLAGWVRLGSGYYGSVWQHPSCPDTVLKIGRYSCGVPGRDGWLDYIRALETIPSRHAPRVHAVEMYRGYYYAEIELLKPLPESRYHDLGLNRYARNLNEIGPNALRDFMKDVEEARRSAGRHADYHAGNYMRRPGTDEVVLTDPWC